MHGVRIRYFLLLSSPFSALLITMIERINLITPKTLPYTHTLSHVHHINTLSLSTYTHSLFFSPSLTPTNTLSVSLPPSHTQIHTISLYLTHTHTLTTLTHTLTTLTHTLSLSHTHTLSHTLTHTHSIDGGFTGPFICATLFCVQCV